jgi:hypothetical protein
MLQLIKYQFLYLPVYQTYPWAVLPLKFGPFHPGALGHITLEIWAILPDDMQCRFCIRNSSGRFTF